MSIERFKLPLVWACVEIVENLAMGAVEKYQTGFVVSSVGLLGCARGRIDIFTHVNTRFKFQAFAGSGFGIVFTDLKFAELVLQLCKY